MSVGNKRIKKEQSQQWQNLIEEYAPGLYKTIDATGEREAIDQIVSQKPEIIMISDKIKDPIKLLKTIKSIHPEVVVFIMLSIAEDDEVIDNYIAHGAYKCYTPPLVIDTLVHDMYVSLNMECI